jgi:hypothetical protein
MTRLEGLQIVHESRVFPRQHLNGERAGERAVPLSLLDATTANFGLTSAIWLLERPSISLPADPLTQHLRISLATALEAYPQWCGYLKAILSIDTDSLPPETASFPAHAKRYGRVYVHFNTGRDPGVAFSEATSTATVDELYNAASAKRRPVWNRQEDRETLTQFVPQTSISSALDTNEKGMNGLYEPTMAIQCTKLACGGLVLAAKIAHPLADITALTRFVRDWADVSLAMLADETLPSLKPVFDPSRLDACAAGDINDDEADPATMQDALALPLHRYDWWTSPGKPPSVFSPNLPPAGKPMPWPEWDTKAQVEQNTVHFTREQTDTLWRSATTPDALDSSSGLRTSKHDALLAHVWSCVARARGLQEDGDPIHCDLVLGTRPAFQLDDSFIGSPTMMLNIEMPATEIASGKALPSIAHRIRSTISTVNNPQRLASHLHSIAFEESPQRIWQAFLGRRHILVTTWARAGLYNVDFGLGSRIRYADGVVPCLDGCILIVDSAPVGDAAATGSSRREWTENGVDVTIPLRAGDMRRLLGDGLLLPEPRYNGKQGCKFQAELVKVDAGNC